MTFYVYILKTSSNTLYVGQTNDLEKRLREHKKKSVKSAKYLRYFKSFELVYYEQFSTRSEALKREWEIKHRTRTKKDTLIKNAKIPQMENKTLIREILDTNFDTKHVMSDPESYHVR